MSSLDEIREAIARLSLEDRCALLSELLGYDDDDEWDRQMKADAAAGKFDEMNRQAEEDLRAGRTRPLEDLL